MGACLPALIHGNTPLSNSTYCLVWRQSIISALRQCCSSPPPITPHATERLSGHRRAPVAPRASRARAPSAEMGWRRGSPTAKCSRPSYGQGTSTQSCSGSGRSRGAADLHQAQDQVCLPSSLLLPHAWPQWYGGPLSACHSQDRSPPEIPPSPTPHLWLLEFRGTPMLCFPFCCQGSL